MKKILFTLLHLLAISSMSPAQGVDEEKKVYTALQYYIDGFYEGDSIKLQGCISPEVVKYGFWKEKNSAHYEGEPMSYSQMMVYAGNVKARGRQQKPGTIRKVEVFEVQDQTASGKITVWWGTDYVLLNKVNGQWLIRMILWQGPLINN